MTKIAGKQEILFDLERRVADKILEQSNFDLLKKLVENADTLDEAIKIAELGTTYMRFLRRKILLKI
jgi:adenine-specific DNA-methyltransferase